MKFLLKVFVLFFLSSVLFSCKSMIVDKASTMLSGADRKGIPVQKKAGAPDPMAAFMGEKDPTIITEVLPTIVKMYEIMALSNPDHDGIQIMAGQLNVMYGNLCVQTPAEKFSVARLDEQVAEFNRAKYHYLKGRRYILDAFERRWPGFTKDFLGSDKEAAEKAAGYITKEDVNAAYWCAGSSLIAWSLDPLDIDALSSIVGPVALLERAAALEPDYSQGAIWDALCQFYVAAPIDFGGDFDRGLYCYEQALKVSGGKAPGIYVTYAQSIARPSGDRDGFEKALESALAINPDDDPDTRLMCVINQQKARYLLDHIDDYFVVW